MTINPFSAKRLEELRQNGGTEPLNEPAAKHKKHRQRAKSAETFARIPYEQGMQLAGRRPRNVLLAVLLELDHQVFVNHGKNPVALGTAALRKHGFDHKGKCRALAQLQAARMVSVVWRGRRSPLVTVLWQPVG
jgi:hypothetical protein